MELVGYEDKLKNIFRIEVAEQFLVKFFLNDEMIGYDSKKNVKEKIAIKIKERNNLEPGKRKINGERLIHLATFMETWNSMYILPKKITDIFVFEKESENFSTISLTEEQINDFVIKLLGID